MRPPSAIETVVVRSVLRQLELNDGDGLLEAELEIENGAHWWAKDAADVRQKLAVRILGKMRRDGVPEHPFTFALTCLRNLLSSERKRPTLLLGMNLDEVHDKKLMSPLEAAAVSSVLELLQKERKRVLESIERMSSFLDRQVLVWALQGLSNDEMAERAGTRPGTMATRLSRANRRIGRGQPVTNGGS